MKSVTSACLHQPDEILFTFQWMNTHSDGTLSRLSPCPLTRCQNNGKVTLEKINIKAEGPSPENGSDK